MDNNPSFAPTLVAATVPLLRLGRYQILGEIGQGAMGIVYEARDPTLERHVALKTVRLPSNLQGAGEFRARFHAEAKSAGRLSHPNIVTIYDFGEAEDTAYIAMELLRGETLRELLDRQRFSVRRAIRYAIQIADGLSAAHALGVIHRDIKPGNVVRLESGILKITDFGIAQLPTSNLTQAGTLLGTPRYMSPELIRGTRVDPRSDLFSLGVVLYEMLTSQVPFDGESLSSIMYKVVNEQAADPRDVNEHVSAGLVAVLSRCLAKDPVERFENAVDLSRYLRALSEDNPVEVSMLPTFAARSGAGAEDSSMKRGLSGFLKRVDRTLPLTASTRPKRSVETPAEKTTPVKAPSTLAVTPKPSRGLAVAIPFVVAVVVMIGVFGFYRLHDGDNAAGEPASDVIPAAAASGTSVPASAVLEPATPNPALVGEASSSVPGAAPALEIVDEKITLGGGAASSVSGKKPVKKKAPEPTPVPTVAEAPPPPAAAPIPVAAPVAPPAPAQKTESLQEQLKRQHDCLVMNHCDN